eukprot:2048180-Prymnesium_polylepis.2
MIRLNAPPAREVPLHGAYPCRRPLCIQSRGPRAASQSFAEPRSSTGCWTARSSAGRTATQEKRARSPPTRARHLAAGRLGRGTLPEKLSSAMEAVDRVKAHLVDLGSHGGRMGRHVGAHLVVNGRYAIFYSFWW